jgi:hypothetical protein
MSEEQVKLFNNKSIKIDEIMKYNETLIDNITEELKKYQKDEDLDEASLLILEKEIGIINYIKRNNDLCLKVIKRIEKDALSGKKSELKKKKKDKKKKKKCSSTTTDSDSEIEKLKKKQSTSGKKAQTEGKKLKTDNKKVKSEKKITFYKKL